MVLLSKIIFATILILSLSITGSGFVSQEAHATVPVFTAIHNSTTTTEVTFATPVNGTLRTDNWFVNGVVVTGVTNGTTPSAANKAVTAIAYGANSLGWLNDTTTLKLTHQAIKSYNTLVVTYNLNSASNVGGNLHDGSKLQSAYGVGGHPIANGTATTGVDGIPPIPISAKTTGLKKIEITMSEPIGNINATGADFTILGLNDSTITNIVSVNGTMKLHLTSKNIIGDRDNLSLTYTLNDRWITDSTNTPAYADDQGRESHGNRLVAFSGLVIATPGKSSTANFANVPHIHDEVKVQVNSGIPVISNIQNNYVKNILSYVGDVIYVTVSVGDNYSINDISKIKLITNYAKEPSDMNKYFTTNYNDYNQIGLSVYELYLNKNDVKYDYAGTISWNEPTVESKQRTEAYHAYVGPLPGAEKELLVTYSMSMNKEMPQTEVRLKITDIDFGKSNFILPFTLEVLPNNTIIITEPIEEPVKDSPSPETKLAKITLVTNKNLYENGDKVIVTGQIDNYNLNSMKGQNILYSVVSPENVVLSSGHIGPDSDGYFYFTTFAMDNLWKTDGDYVFSVNLSSVKQTIDIAYNNTKFQLPIFESGLEVATPEVATPEVATPEVATPEVATPEVATPEVATPEVATPATISELSNSNILCGVGTEDVNGICQVAKTEINNSSRGGGCLIATAAYGSEMSPQVQLLREIRDNQLMNTEAGSAFMGAFNSAYYSFSPIIADMEREHPMFKEVVKLGLTPMINSLSIMENANSESEVLGIGISVIMLNIGMYLGVPAVVIVGIRRII